MATYYVVQFLQSDNVLIDPELADRITWRFSMDEAREFFLRFEDVAFDLPDDVGSILIFDGRHDWPNHSHAFGYLFAQSLNDVRLKHHPPRAVATINFDIGGHLRKPSIKVSPLRSPHSIIT